MKKLALLPLIAFGCESYQPPIEIERVNVDRGVYDPAAGPLAVRFTGPIDPASLTFSLFLDRRGTEGEMCLGESLPGGCPGEAAAILGPCKADPSMAERVDEGVRYVCQGGAFVLDLTQQEIVIEPEARLIPYERYVLVFAPGLTDRAGIDRATALELIFQRKGDLPRGPTTFQGGMFFSVVEAFEPVNSQFHFFFWMIVDSETGEFRTFAADADPEESSIDPKVNREPGRWIADPNGPTGSFITGQGQIADDADGRVLQVYPFLLSVSSPRVDAVSAEVGARIRTGTLPGYPGGDREIIEGTFYSPEIYLGVEGQRAALGPGRGKIELVRLFEDETVPLETLVPRGKTLEELLAEP
jgi:hypothetical protein